MEKGKQGRSCKCIICRNKLALDGDADGQSTELREGVDGHTGGHKTDSEMERSELEVLYNFVVLGKQDGEVSGNGG